MKEARELKQARLALFIFVIGLVGSGLTAIPLRVELQILNTLAGEGAFLAEIWPVMGSWVTLVHEALEQISVSYPFLVYGYDWLAFGHFAMAIMFIGAIQDPLRNRWVIEAGIIACALVIGYAFVFGEIRGILIFWRGIDCLFGVFGMIPLWYARQRVLVLESHVKPSAMMG